MDTQLVFAKFVEVFLAQVLPVLAVAFAGWFVLWWKQTWQKIKAERPDIAAAIEAIAPMAVQAAEEAKLSGFVDDKFEYAVGIVSAYLKEQGYPINLELIFAGVKAAVFTEFNDYRDTELVDSKAAALEVKEARKKSFSNVHTRAYYLNKAGTK